MKCVEAEQAHTYLHLLIAGAEAAALGQVGQVFLRLLHVRVDLIQTLLNSLQLLCGRRRRRTTNQEEKNKSHSGSENPSTGNATGS